MLQRFAELRQRSVETVIGIEKVQIGINQGLHCQLDRKTAVEVFIFVCRRSRKASYVCFNSLLKPQRLLLWISACSSLLVDDVA